MQTQTRIHKQPEVCVKKKEKKNNNKGKNQVKVCSNV